MIKINNKWKHTEEEIKKVSEYHRKNKNTKEYKERNKKISDKLKGIKKESPSKETRKKMSKSRKKLLKDKTKHTMYGKKHSKETIKKMSLSRRKRKTNSEEQKKKISETMKKWWKKYRNSKKVKLMLEKKKISMKGKLSGNKHPNWQGGKSFEPYSTDWTETLKHSIRQRDNFKCRVCNKLQSQTKRKLDIHHINYNKQDCNPKNLISLCIKCHRATNYNKKYWIKYFKEECPLM